MIWIRNLDEIADNGVFSFSYLDTIDDSLGGDGKPRKPWRIPISTLEVAAAQGRLKVLPNRRRAVLGSCLKDFILNPRSKKPGAIPRTTPNQGAHGEGLKLRGGQNSRQQSA